MAMIYNKGQMEKDSCNFLTTILNNPKLTSTPQGSRVLCKPIVITNGIFFYKLSKLIIKFKIITNLN